MKKINIITLFFLLSSLIMFSSCEEWLDIKPESEETVLEEVALQTGDDLQGLLNAAYQTLSGCYGGAFQRYSDLMADEVHPLEPTSDKRLNVYKRYTTGYFTAFEPYNESYISILRANLVIENIDNVTGLDEADKTQMIAEAKFIRALSHFAVLRLFAQPYGYSADNSHLGIGLKTSSVVEIIPRSTVADVYAQLISDLTDAEAGLPTTSANNAYATSWAAKALLAQVYFQMHDYDNAFTKANDVIENGGFVFDDYVEQRFVLEETTFDYGTEQVVASPSTEGIFKLVSNSGTSNAGGGFGVYRCDDDNVPSIRINTTFYTQNAQTIGADKRTQAWYEVFNAGLDNEYVGLKKYNLDYFDVPVLFLTEQLFIRAESAVLKTTADLTTAVADVNAIRTRSYGGESYNISGGATADVILNTIRFEKSLELIGEGYRVHDLKRRGSGNESDLTIRGVAWDYPGLALQFPINEINELFLPNEEPN